MTVRFPMYFEVVGYRELDIPDDIDADNEDEIMEYIEKMWDDIPLPEMDDVDYVSGSCVFDWDSPIEVIDK